MVACRSAGRLEGPGRAHNLRSEVGAGHDMERLTDMDRARLIAALGQWVLRARKIDPEGLELLLKLSDPDTRLWLHKTAATEICWQNSA
jgi:hypothetical protein